MDTNEIINKVIQILENNMDLIEECIMGSMSLADFKRNQNIIIGRVKELKKLSYNEFIINKLKDPKQVALYLKVATEEYLNDGNYEAVLVAINHIKQAKERWL